MFGDIGHGLIYFIFSIIIIKNSKKFPKVLSDLKYMLFFMGFFSVYCGLIYNDFLGIGFPISNSCYE